jgi:hypothetical protein
MSLVRYDSTNQVLHTNQGNWKTSIPSGGNITVGGQIGSSIQIFTGATANNASSIYDVSTLGTGDGIESFYSTMFKTIVGTVTLTNVVYRIGLMDGNGDTPSNGIYFEFDSSVSSYWRCVCVKAGVATTVTTTQAPYVERLEFAFFVEPKSAGVSFFYEPNGGTYPLFIGTIATNIPTVPLSFVARIKTTTTANASWFIYSTKIGTQDEIN